MRSSKIILALWLGASAWAQSLPQKPQAHPPVEAKPSAAQSVKPMVATPPKAPSANGPAKPVATSATPVAKPSQPPAASPAKPAPATIHVAHSARKKHVRSRSAGQPLIKAATVVSGKPSPTLVRGQRDPFVSPLVERLGSGASCTGSGRKCLAVGEIALHGVVSSPNGFIAVVVHGDHTYFLRENDPLANGAVERITRDAIVMRERTSDALGRPFTREVTRKLGVPAV
ncbi:MAG TPA: hypothetical protein VM578_07665 [Candidatus Saccharimonadales bacterium]|nr:hypothetical protein [Candidatus Saccharimonadales bacterium]